jgi:hypothetical protein
VDVNKISPAPWELSQMGSKDGRSVVVYGRRPLGKGFTSTMVFDSGATTENAEFIALARNAFEVMMQRGWGVSWVDERWVIRDMKGMCLAGAGYKEYPDPFTALVEADKWYRANVEKETDL